jgi:hypothetical protein
MFKVLMIMYHIALCTTCITLVNCGHLLYIRVDHAEPKSEFQAEQVQWAFGGSQSPCVKDANNPFGSRQALVHPTKILVFYI